MSFALLHVTYEEVNFYGVSVTLLKKKTKKNIGAPLNYFTWTNFL